MNLRFDWFGWTYYRESMPARGPRWFISRGANYLYFSLGGLCSVTVPWFWAHAAIDAQGYDRGWNAGYQSGYERGLSVRGRRFTSSSIDADAPTGEEW